MAIKHIILETTNFVNSPRKQTNDEEATELDTLFAAATVGFSNIVVQGYQVKDMTKVRNARLHYYVISHT